MYKDQVRVTPPPVGCTCPVDTGYGNGRKSHIVGNVNCFIDRQSTEKLRKIPVVQQGDSSKHLGWLEVTKEISDELLANCHVSWMVRTSDNKILSVSLVPDFAVRTDD